MIYLTAAIAFFALCSVIVGYFQWSAMRGQLAEMKSGGIDTHALAQAARDQADAAQRFSDTAGDINRGIADAVRKLQIQANQTTKQAGALNSLNAQAMAVPGQQGYPNVQVQWTGIYREANKPFVDIVFRNIGTGMAVSVVVATRIGYRSLPPRPGRDWSFSDNDFKSVADGIPPTDPAAPSGPSIREYGKALSRQETSSLISSGVPVYVWGIIKYTNRFRQNFDPVRFCRYTLARNFLTKEAFGEGDIHPGTNNGYSAFQECPGPN